jgi:flagellar L-ring protein precursor FlgH
MNHSSIARSPLVLAVCGLAATLALPALASAKKQDGHKSDAAFDQALEDYIRQASDNNSAPATTLGSLWTSGGNFTNLTRDDKAGRVGDLITINILETTTAQASGTAKSSRSLSANSSLNAFFGAISPQAGLANIFSPQSQSTLNGAAATSSSHLVSTNLAGTVVKVLPNSYLVVQAARDVYVDSQRQHVIVRGIVRPSDLAPDNSVPSTAIANLQVEVQGKGVISDGTRPPHVLTRLILKLVGF